ncbi:MAG: CinA family nicotinamide mononucleotide deamidase-related protein [Gammaproteobacteria bacterium]
MRCEVIAIGTELLLGQIHDTNSAWIGEQLALAGIDSLYQTKVGDNLDRIVDALRLGLQRSDAVITCGGLGPTQDDITRDAIAVVMGVGMERRADIGERIRHMFESRGRTMPENNLRQADVPRGASIIEQMPGTAPGLVCPVGEKIIYAVPGVPNEMRTMMNGTILPDLQQRAGVAGVIKSRVLKTWGHSESGLAELLGDRITELDQLGNPTLAFQASGIEGLKVRITAKADDENHAQIIISDEEELIRGILGNYIFGVDEQTMESVIIDSLNARQQTIAIAEVASGGLVSARLTQTDGHHSILAGSVVATSSDARKNILGLKADEIGTREAAKSLAVQVREKFNADIGLSTTGIFDIDPTAAATVGETYLGIATHDGVDVAEVKLPGDRKRVREFSVISLLNALRLNLQ